MPGRISGADTEFLARSPAGYWMASLRQDAGYLSGTRLGMPDTESNTAGYKKKYVDI